MDDLISRQAAVDLMMKTPYLNTGGSGYTVEELHLFLAQEINGLPSADVKPVRPGHWIHIRTEEDGNALYECSVCGKGEVHVPIIEVSYCWNCGARMDEGSQND